MKRNHWAILVTLFIWVIAAVAAIMYIDYDSSTDRLDVDLYFMNEDGTGIIAETREMKYKSGQNMAETVLEKLRKGPATSKRGRIMPRDTKVQSVEFSGDGGITVDFSSSFLSEDSSKNVLSVYAVTKSLCSAGIASRVYVTVDGNAVIDRDGNQMGFVAASDINLETEEYQSEMRNVVLYFAGHNGGGLVKEERTIKISDQQPIEQYIINELIKGPGEKGNQPVLSKNTVLISVDVEDNICYLNFKSSFLKENSGSEEHDRQVIYSIVNSLTELMTISRVQFYMNGKRVDSFGNIDIKGYVSRDTSIISIEAAE